MCTLTVVAVSFDHSVDTVDEGGGMAQITIVLSNPVTDNITVIITDNGNTANGKYSFRSETLL